MANTLQVMKRHLNRDPNPDCWAAEGHVFFPVDYLHPEALPQGLNLPSRTMAYKPLLTKAMKDKWFTCTHDT
jgi:hypothetical protein